MTAAFHCADYFAHFAPDATFVFYTTAAFLGARAEYEAEFDRWEADGFRVLSCDSSDQRVQVAGDAAVFTHRVATRAIIGGEEVASDERETIVFRREPDGRWLAIHEHLSATPAASCPSMARAIGVVGVQVAPRPYDVEVTLDKFSHEVRRLAAAFPALDLYVFPELYLSALGSYGDDPPAGYAASVAELIPGPLAERVADLARQVGKWIAAGSVYERAGDRIHNTALVVSPAGELVSTYRKLFPWMPYEETDPGDAYAVFDISGVGRFGLAICYDGWVPEIPRTLAWLGAEVILQPTATRTVDREQELVLARANAIVNQVFVVSPNNGGMFGGGRSVIVDPEGRLMVVGGSGEEFLTQVLDLDAVTTTREYGTAGLKRLWKQLRDAPPPLAGPYRHGFAAGLVMDRLGPLSGPGSGSATRRDDAGSG
ncbi:MAG: nitrilase-related carbon-nitrogen hydrolase [Chloroflexota bacterium]